MEAARSMRLWELGDELEEIGRELIEAGGELTPELEARLDAIEGAWHEKVERIALAAQDHKATAAGAKVEADRLAAIVRAHERAESSLKGYLLHQMERQGRDRVETPRARVRVQANSRPAIRCAVHPDALPERFRVVTVSTNTSALYDAWKAGETLPEGVVAERGKHVRIS